MRKQSKHKKRILQALCLVMALCGMSAYAMNVTGSNEVANILRSSSSVETLTINPNGGSATHIDGTTITSSTSKSLGSLIGIGETKSFSTGKQTIDIKGTYHFEVQGGKGGSATITGIGTAQGGDGVTIKSNSVSISKGKELTFHAGATSKDVTKPKIAAFNDVSGANQFGGTGTDVYKNGGSEYGVRDFYQAVYGYGGSCSYVKFSGHSIYAAGGGAGTVYHYEYAGLPNTWKGHGTLKGKSAPLSTADKTTEANSIDFDLKYTNTYGGSFTGGSGLWTSGIGKGAGEGYKDGVYGAVGSNGMAMYIVKDGMDVVRSYGETWAHRNYPDITDEEELAKLSIIKYFYTEKEFVTVLNRLGVDITQRHGATGTANYKWLQSCAKYFNTSEEHFGIPAASKAGEDVTNQEMLSTGWNFAVIEVSLPPIHTYWEAYGTPGNTEPPDPTAATDGDCIIRKLYYTEELASDGTVITEAKDYHSYKQEGTTNYIVIDTESDYVLEGWKASSTNRELNIKDNFYSISATQSGDSAEEIEIDVDNGVKYVYLLFKKTEVNPNPSQPYDFQLQQSQITKRVTFLDGTGPANTSSLFTHNFTWTASAPTQTSCTANSNKGHLKCTTSEHTHSDSCYTEDADGNKSLTCTTSEHTHTDSCYEKCSSWQWTDNTTSLGITLDTSTINKAVVSKNDSITYNQPAVNTITTSNKYYKDNTSTRSGTSQNTQSISNFNYITVLFRGQDHLTLADWKNGGAISYLTSLAYDSAYNFKSANTPQGTRKSGTEYNETFVTRFINRSPDMSTTYKATVGSAGICSTTASSYRFDTSTALTINGIVVNDPVGFIFFCTFLEQQTHIKYNHNSSDKINSHVTAMVIFI